VNSRQLKTLGRVVDQPIRADIKWKDTRSLLEAVGATVDEGKGSGSRIAIDFKDRTFMMHKPKTKELKQYQVKDLREFLTEMGVTP